MKPFNFITGIGVALAANYFLDPRNGKRRRAEIGQKFGRYERRKARAIRAAWDDVRNRLSGTVHEAKSAFSDESGVPDQVVEERVRAMLGRCSRHPAAIHVSAMGGVVRLEGHVLASEVQEVVRVAKATRGVVHVDNQLRVHDSADAPMLQGAGHIPASASTLKPGTALMVGVAGLGLAMGGLGRRDGLGKALSLIGIGLLAKGLNDIEGNRTTGPGKGTRNGSQVSNTESASSDYQEGPSANPSLEMLGTKG